MKTRLILAAFLGTTTAALAQSSVTIPLKPSIAAGTTAKPADAAKPAGPPVLLLRGLDKITGRATEFLAPMNKIVHYATFDIVARFCYSTPASETPETSAFVQITDKGPEGTASRQFFSGWMYASSPGLNAVQHPLYDVWVKRCITEEPGQTAAVSDKGPIKVRSPVINDREAAPDLPEEAGQ